ncbi:MAG: glycosyltransferase family 4 protein [Patescibacteria group bacterium]
MPKIFLFESGSTGWSGSFKSCFYIASALKAKGYSVAVGYINKSDYWSKLRGQNIPVVRFVNKLYSQEIKGQFFFKILRNIDGQMKKWLSFLPFPIDGLINFQFVSDIRKFLQEQKIDLVHTNTSFFRDVEILKIASKLYLPIICHLRGYPYRQLTLMEKNLVKYEKVCFIAISKSIQNKWIKAGLPKEKIELIYNAQPKLTEQIGEKERTVENNLECIPVRLLFVGRLSKVKGVDILIKALKNIDKKLWTLSIVGNGTEKIIFKKLAKDCEILDNITFYGYQEKVNDFYRDHDIVIVPSLKEPFGRVVIEAMQFAVPVIASDIDGPAEIIENSKDGILFEMGNSKALKEAINYLIENPEKRIELGLSGREKQKLFSEEIFMEKLLKVYNKLLIN